MATNDIWALTVRGLVTETTHIHTLHFKEMVPQSGGAPLIAAWVAAAGVPYRNMFPLGQVPIQFIQARKVCGSVPLPSPDESNPAFSDGQGNRQNVNGEFLPAYVATCVTEKGAVAGRRYSGRFFIGGMLESDTNGNQLVAGWLGIVQAYCDALKTAFVTPTLPNWKLFSYSKLLGEGDQNRQIKNPNGPGTITSPVDAVTDCQDAGSEVKQLIINTRPTTMRSRKYGHGS